MKKDLLKLGTRGSPLALRQAEEARDRLIAAHEGLAVEIVTIKTTGDKITDRPLAEVGGKGLFAKELDEALLDGRIDFAVHSMKDLETRMPDGITISAVLEREDVRDALITSKGRSIADLPQDAVVGSSSLRRAAQILARRPDISVITFRGNVQTRLGKLEAGEVDATILAMAGLNRLGMAHVAAAPIAPEEMLPSVAQGAIAITVRTGDGDVHAATATLDHAHSRIRVETERAFLAVLDGSCRTPVAGLAELEGNGMIRFRGLVARPDGTGLMKVERHGPAADGPAMAADAGHELKPRMGPEYFG